ncbi:MAG: asparagine synthetase B [Bacteroidetes bacterium]|nr:asparagine synthetase B [Bacteroidota bacterium]MBU1422738.1 asparagine synthetase B [Bacteroidota bacterium]
MLFALCSLLFVLSFPLSAQKILIPMDLKQTDHLKAYGIAYLALTKGIEVDWLLNYRRGSFMIDGHQTIATECRIRGVYFESIGGSIASQIYAEVQDENNNMDVVRLEKAPKVAVYVPPNFLPWDDAVVLAMEYAEIPYDKVWDDEVLAGKLYQYDWLHLHHEDFTGQYGKFYASFSNATWYVEQQIMYEKKAKELGYKKVSELKKAVVRTIKEYIASGGFIFAMCSATDAFDIALAAENTDICDVMYDGDPPDQNFQKKLDYSKCLAFENFTVERNPMRYEYSDIDIPPSDMAAFTNPETDYFTLFEFSAKYDPVPTMLTQNHANIIRGFMGQTTNFKKSLIKKSVIIMAEKEGSEEVRYINGNFGRGTFTWYGGHDPEDYQHAVGDPPTDLHLYKNSPGYRLILNNILFPAAKKKQQKT